MQFAELLRERLGGILELSDHQVGLLTRHYELLERWNQRLNLTSIRKLEDAVVRHYCESLFFALHLPCAAGKVLDFGSGAGFPGIPLAVLCPSVQVTLAESHQRKAVFLREASRQLANVVVCARRAEECGVGFDWVVSRAVDPLVVVKAAVALGRNVGLMVGESDVDSLLKLEGVRWREPIAMPWGDKRVCVYGCFT